MSFFEALFLGMVQGITEFLPVSSSGHLILFQKILGLKDLDKYMLFDLICHLGTLLAIFLVFFPQIKNTFSDRKRSVQILIGTLPLFPLALLFKPLKNLFNQPEYLGFFFLLTALLLALGEFLKRPTGKLNPYSDALKIGCFQALAILPGVSRSGSTISGAKMLGWTAEEAVTFSFLLSIPAVLGGMTLEMGTLLRSPEWHLTKQEMTACAIGFFTACIVGYAALKILIRIALRDKFQVFIWYCLCIGFLALFIFR